VEGVELLQPAEEDGRRKKQKVKTPSIEQNQIITKNQ
jgi:hypothetical protein